jgi:hypothetical protein
VERAVRHKSSSANITNLKEVNLKKQNIEFLISKQNRNHFERISKKLKGVASSAALATAATSPTSPIDLNNNNTIISITANSEDTTECSVLLKKNNTTTSNLSNGLSSSQALQSSRRSSALKSDELLRLKNTKINQGALQGLNIFHRKYQSGFIDVWWLYDDGGLTILLPYLLMKRKCWRKCKLRIFIQTKNPKTNISEEQRNMATLLSKFRIEFDDLIVFCTLNKKPSAAKYKKILNFKFNHAFNKNNKKSLFL